MVLPIPVVSQLVGRVMSRTGRYRIFPILGAAFMAVGLGLLSTMGPGTPRSLTSVYMALLGIGLGFLMQMTTVLAQNSVSLADVGVASATSPLFRTIGGSLGVAVFGAAHRLDLRRTAHG